MTRAEEHKQIEERLWQSRTQTELFYQISQGLNRARDEAELLQVLVQPLLDYEISGALLLYFDLDETSQPLWAEIMANWHAKSPTGSRFYLPNFPIAHLWLSSPGAPLLIADILTDERCDAVARQFALQAGIQATVIIPLTQTGRWIGLITFTWSTVHLFNSQEVELYRTLLYLVSPVVENRRMVGNLERIVAERTTRLQQEIAERQQIEKENLRLLADLEKIVEERTAALSRREAQYRSLIESSRDYIVVLDQEYKIRYVNSQVEGSVTTQAIDLSDLVFIEPEYQTAARTTFEQVMATGHPASYESPGMRWDNSPGWFQIRVMPIREEGRNVGLTLLVTDITERKQTEEALQTSEEMVLSIIQDVDLGVLLYGPEAEVLLCNKTALELLGLTADQVIGKTSSELDLEMIYEDGRPVPAEAFPVLQAIATGQAIRQVILGVYRPLSRDQVWLIVSAVPELSPEGKVKHVVCSFSDITALKQAQEAVRESEERYHSLFEYATDAIFIESLTGDILAVNEKACHLLGYSRAELLSLKVADIIPFRSPEETEAVHSALRQKEHLMIEGQNIHKDGSLIDVEISIRVIDLKNQRVAQIFARDITRRKIAEQSLQNYAAELERSNRELQDFAYVASHDLQEPLRKIQTFGDRLKQRYEAVLDWQGRDYLERIQRAAARMQILIQDLLTFSRVTTQARPFTEVDLTSIVKDVLSDLETRIEEVGGQVELNDLPMIDADRTQMRQLFQNLISNALKFHRPAEPPFVKIYSHLPQEDHQLGRHSLDSPFIQILVEDNGIGFDEKHLDRIFGLFQRLHSYNQYEGAGVGLAVCRKIVKRHGGDITARSKPGQGTTFIVDLPIKQPYGGVAR